MGSARNKQTQGVTTIVEPSPLLKLSPELRNKIYRYVLVSNLTICAGFGGFKEPPLLTTSKQIRHETSTIFYGENKIEFRVDDYDIAKCIRWEQKLQAAYQHRELCTRSVYSIEIGYSSIPNWANLLVWLKAYHDGLAPIAPARPSQIASPGIMDDMILGGVFMVVAGMADKRWSYVEKIVEEQRFILGQINSAWWK